jgi:two-component system response regulator YesN
MVYIHDHYSNALGRKEIAAHVGVSQEYLSSCFHREVGVPLVNYVERYRLRRAKELLVTTEKSITEIALEVGFNDSSYFGRIFRRENGISPLAYRRGPGN